MSDTENKPTTQTQQILIILISVVLVLLFGQLLITADTNSPATVDRETCLNRGDVWSQSVGECYESDGR